MIACFNYLVGLCPNRQAGATSDGSNGNELAIFLHLFIYLFFSETFAIQLVAKMPECAVEQNLSLHRNLVSGFRSNRRKTIYTDHRG